MTRSPNLRRYLDHPFWQALGLLVLAYLVIVYGVPLLPGSSLVPRQDNDAHRARESAAPAARVARRVYGLRQGDLLPELPALSRGSLGWSGTLRGRFQSAASQLPGQWDHRPAHRELRLLAGCEGRARSAA